MKTPFTGLVAAAALLVAFVSTAAGQEAAPATAYTGPLYPGGPDSLRALLHRSTQLASPRPSGRVVLKFELKNRIQPSNFELILPPGPPNPNLLAAAAAATEYLQGHMLAWQAGAPDPTLLTTANPKLRLLLDYNATSAAQPYAYADQNPALPEALALRRAQKNQRAPVNLDYSSRSLIAYIQRQVKYPPAALRQRLQGVAYAYFEVAENGAIERPAIVGTVGEPLDEAVLKTIENLPVATVPALLHGRPVRVYYALPITFVIQ